jgi:hypothetical protein
MRLSPIQLVRLTFDLATGRTIWPTGPHPCGCSERGCVWDAALYQPSFFMCTPCSQGHTLKREDLGMSDQADFSLSDGPRECDSCGRALDWRDECGCVECPGLPFCEPCAERHLDAHLAGLDAAA